MATDAENYQAPTMSQNYYRLMFSSDPRQSRQYTRHNREEDIQIVTTEGNRAARYHQKTKIYEAVGGFATVWRADLDFVDGIRQQVAVKELRNVPSRLKTNDATQTLTEVNMLTRLARECRVWMKLNHPNVAPLLGFQPNPLTPALISPWYEEGSVVKFLEKYPSTDRAELLLQTARGIAYLHSQQIVHGDIKPDNILVANDGTIKIIDFGLSHEGPGRDMNSMTHAFNIRWVAPEIIEEREEDEDAPRSPKTVASDIWAFGCVALWAFTGKDPYENVKQDINVPIKLVNGVAPADAIRRKWPAIFDESEWGKLMYDCWNRDPSARPSMTTIEAVIEEIREPPVSL